MKITYNGEISPMRINVGGAIFNNWKRGESREVSEEQAKKLLKNSQFSTNAPKKQEEKKVKEEKEVEEEIDYDFNDDGVVDEKDASMAGKLLSSRRKK